MPVSTADSYASRRVVGAALLEAASALDTRSIAVKLAQFRKAQQNLAKAEDALAAAEARLIDAQRDVAEFDNDQDAAVAALASSLIAVGQPRINPFRKLSKYAPARMQEIGYGEEAKALLELSGKTRRLAGATPELHAAAREADRSARALLAAIVVAERAAERVTAARERRDALGQPWETALATLRRAARAMDQNGSPGFFDALFKAAARRAKSLPPKRLEA